MLMTSERDGQQGEAVVTEAVYTEAVVTEAVGRDRR